MVSPRYFVAPTAEPLIGTLLDTAVVESGIEWLDGEGLFESYNSLTFGATDADFCQPNEKTFDQAAEWVNGFRMVAYGGTVCKSVGLDQGAMLTGVEKAFEMNASVAVEAGMMAHRFQAKTGAAGWDAPVDITPASGAVKPIVGVSMLEGWMARRYVGRPVIHMPTVITGLLTATESIVIDGQLIHTKLGSSVVNGAGYDEPNLAPTSSGDPLERDEAAVGEKWLYVTGAVLARKGEIAARQAMDYSTNEVYTLAEEAYVVAVDGPVAAIRVLVTG